MPNKADAMSLSSVVKRSATPTITTVSTAPAAPASPNRTTETIMPTTSICTLAPDSTSPSALHHSPLTDCRLLFAKLSASSS